MVDLPITDSALVLGRFLFWFGSIAVTAALMFKCGMWYATRDRKAIEEEKNPPMWKDGQPVDRRGD